MDNMAVMLIMNNKFAPLAYPMLLSLISNNTSKISFYIITDDLTNDNRDNLKVFLSKRGCSVYLIDIDCKIFSQYQSTDQFPPLLYSKIAPHLFLPNSINRILYLDIDVIVCGDLIEFYNQDFQNKYICACYGWKAFRAKFFDYNNKLSDDVDAFNSGVVLYNLDAMRNNISLALYAEWYDNFISKNAQYQVQYEEWLMVNVMRNRICYTMPFDYNYNINAHAIELYDKYCQERNIKPLIKIIHFLPLYNTTIKKPWFYYKYFVENTFEELPIHIAKFYKLWWDYAMKLPYSILNEYRVLAGG